MTDETEAPEIESPETAEEAKEARLQTIMDKYTTGVEDDPEPVEVDEDEEEAPQEEGTAPDPQPEAKAAELSDDTLIEVTLPGGEKQTITLAEARRGYSREADYTRKTMEIAEQRKAFEAKLGNYDQRIEAYVAPLEAELNKLASVDWEAVIAEHGAEGQAAFTQYQLKLGKYQQAQAEKQAIQTERQRLAAEEKQAYIAQEQKRLAEVLPEALDPAKQAQFWSSLYGFMEKSGYRGEEIKELADHRTVTVLEKARKFDELMAQKATLLTKEKKPGVPIIQKPGTRRDPSVERQQERQADLRAVKRNPTAEERRAFIEKHLI